MNKKEVIFTERIAHATGKAFSILTKKDKTYSIDMIFATDYFFRMQCESQVITI